MILPQIERKVLRKLSNILIDVGPMKYEQLNREASRMYMISEGTELGKREFIQQAIIQQYERRNKK